MIEFVAAFIGALIGSIVGAVIVATLKKVEASAPPDTKIKKVLSPVAEPTAKVNDRAIENWLWGSKEAKE